MLVDFPGEIEVFRDSGFLAVYLDTGDCLLHGAVVGEIDFQGLFFGSLCRIGPVTFRRLLDTEHVRVLAPAYPHLLEVVATLLVVEGVDGEYLLLLYGGQSELLIIASFTMGESITSLSSCVTTPAMP